MDNDSIKTTKMIATDWQSNVSSQYGKWLEVNGSGKFTKKPIKGVPKLISFVLLGAPKDTKHTRQLIESAGNSFEITDVSHATGEYIIFLQPHTELWADALVRISYYLSTRPDAQLAYFDSEIHDRLRRRKVPYFKPDYSPDLLLSSPYFMSPLIIRRELYGKLEPISITDPVFMWDLALKAVERTDAIAHFPSIVATTIVSSMPVGGLKGSSLLTARRELSIVAKAIGRRGLDAKVVTGPLSGTCKVIYKPSSKLVSIIISTKDRHELLARCVNGILNNNDYDNWELIIINNNSEQPETFRYFDKLRTNPKIRIIDYPKKFNIAAIFNLAADKANGEYLCFMGNDTEPISRDWLSRMTGYMQRPEVGIVGAKLLYPNNTIQHAGVVLGYGSAPDNSDRVAGHPYSQFPVHPGYFGAIELQRNYSAVTGAVTLTRKSVYKRVGGYDAKRLRMLFNDVDYCLKVRREGYYVVYAPESVLYHHERASLGEVSVDFHIDPREIRYMRKTWSFWEDNDPYYNPNLTLDRQDYSLRIPPRELNI